MQYFLFFVFFCILFVLFYRTNSWRIYRAISKIKKNKFNDFQFDNQLVKQQVISFLLSNAENIILVYFANNLFLNDFNENQLKNFNKTVEVIFHHNATIKGFNKNNFFIKRYCIGIGSFIIIDDKICIYGNNVSMNKNQIQVLKRLFYLRGEK